MLRYYEKYYIQRDFYNCYLPELVDDKKLSKDVLD